MGEMHAQQLETEREDRDDPRRRQMTQREDIETTQRGDRDDPDPTGTSQTPPTVLIARYEALSKY